MNICKRHTYQISHLISHTHFLLHICSSGYLCLPSLCGCFVSFFFSMLSLVLLMYSYSFSLSIAYIVHHTCLLFFTTRPLWSLYRTGCINEARGLLCSFRFKPSSSRMIYQRNALDVLQIMSSSYPPSALCCCCQLQLHFCGFNRPLCQHSASFEVHCEWGLDEHPGQKFSPCTCFFHWVLYSSVCHCASWHFFVH